MKRLKDLRKSRKETQADIAKLIGITRAAYSNIETGRRETDFSTLRILADHFDVSIDYLLGRDDAKKEPVTVSDDELSADEKTILALYRQVAPGDKDLVLGMIEAALKNRGE